VSNHFGNVGFGHYTAYGKSVTDDKWYQFDDSHVSPVRNDESVITNSAYSLFYRLRGYCDLNDINFDHIKKVPEKSYFDNLERQKKENK